MTTSSGGGDTRPPARSLGLSRTVRAAGPPTEEAARERGDGGRKVTPDALAALLGKAGLRRDRGADDAAVIKLLDDLAVLSTVGFAAPVVDDAFDFGRIAAASALSNVYAMAARPVCALNVLGVPAAFLRDDDGTAAAILAGGAAVAEEAGVEVSGGHTVRLDEPVALYGMAITATAHPRRIARNSGGKPGDRLILTKPLGLGVVAAAALAGRDELDALGEAIAIMTTLNAAAARALSAVAAHAATDISGSGLLGHLRGLAQASGLSARVFTHTVPVLDAARSYMTKGLAPAATHENWRALQSSVSFAVNVSKADQLLLCDAQPSGGLLIAAPPHLEGDLLAVLRAEGTLAAAVIGELVSGEPGAITVGA